MSEKNRFWSSLPIIAFATLTLAGLASLGSYTRFMADDYCSAYAAHQFGLLRSIWYWYIHWSGRYAAFAFDWLVLIKTFGPYGAHLVPPISIALWSAATIAAVYLSLQDFSSHHSALMVSILLGVSFVTTVITLSPDIAQSYYWLNGMRSYSLPLVLLSAYTFLFLWSMPRLKTNQAIFIACIASLAFAFFNGGFSETYAVLQFAMFVFLVVFQWLTNDRKMDTKFRLLAFAVIGALLSIIVIILAPGNAVRRAASPPAPAFIKLAQISIGAYLAFIQEILLSPRQISALIGALFISVWAGFGYKNEINSKSWMIPALVAGGLILSFVCIPPSVYGYVNSPPPRTLSIAVFGLATCWMSASFLIGSWLAHTLRSSARMEIGLLVAATLLIGISSVMTINYVNQQRGAYIAFAQKWDAMDAQILQARANHQASVTIPAMINWAALERPNDNKKFWATVCYSEYYGIQVYGPPY